MTVELTIEAGDPVAEFTRWYAVKVGGVELYREVVYDHPENLGERNILLLFGSRLRRLLEDES